MEYKIVVTKTAKIQLTSILDYLRFQLNNPDAAESFLNDLDNSFNFLITNAHTLCFCRDERLKEKGYRKINLKNHKYLLIYELRESVVYILGVFHSFEDFPRKLICDFFE